MYHPFAPEAPLPVLLNTTTRTESLLFRTFHPQRKGGSHPHHVLDLCTFLGMAVYFSHYIPYYSDTAALLFQLLRKA